VKRALVVAKQLRETPKHPHLVAVIAIEGDEIVEEEVEGIAASEIFFRLSLAARLRIVVDVLAGLSALHTLAGGAIVHGGILLRATFVDQNGRAKIGRSWMEKDSHAPESLLGDASAIGVRTDVYGAGVMLWEAVSGNELFGIDAPEEILKKQLACRIKKALPPPRERWASVLLPVIERALAVDPKDRYASVAEMAAALRIAVRARLMSHEDVVEEIWPAATAPKVQSGVQPAAQLASEPHVADAAPAPIAVPTPSEVIPVASVASGALGALGALGVSDAPNALDASGALDEHPSASGALAPSRAPARSRARAKIAGVALVLAAVALVVSLGGYAVRSRASSRGQASRGTAIATSDPRVVPAASPASPAVAAPAPSPIEDQERTRPTQTPAAASTAAPARKAKPKTPYYDPSTI